MKAQQTRRSAASLRIDTLPWLGLTWASKRARISCLARAGGLPWPRRVGVLPNRPFFDSLSAARRPRQRDVRRSGRFVECCAEMFGRLGEMFGAGDAPDEEAIARLYKTLAANRKRLINLLKAWCTDAGGVVQLRGARHSVTTVRCASAHRAEPFAQISPQRSARSAWRRPTASRVLCSGSSTTRTRAA